jgi:hypothetical protein
VSIYLYYPIANVFLVLEIQMKLTLLTCGFASGILLTSVTAFDAATQSANAAIVQFSGSDSGATAVGGNSLTQSNLFNTAAAGLGSVNLIDFEGLADGSNPVVLPGVTVTGAPSAPAGTVGVNTSATIDNLLGGNTTAGGSKYWRTSVIKDTVFAFANPVQAFGAYITGLGSASVGQALLLFNDGSAQTFNLSTAIGNANGGVGFFGFTDAGKFISSVTFKTGTGTGEDVYGIDDVRYVSSTAIPTPALLPGLVGIGLAAMRKRKNQAIVENV